MTTHNAVPEERCGCCKGVEELTPLPTANRPGLDALSYRVGTHSTFLETMQARLSRVCLGDEEACKAGKGPYPLRNLTTRDADDPAVAMLDAWATVADVLTFYQERIANEGYLRTATERRSILELARLVGYRPRPGVAASVFLAFTLEEEYQVEIPAGTRAQSIPGPGETPQAFETSTSLEARTEWSGLQVRMTQPQRVTASVDTLYFEGTATDLAPNDPLLVDFGAGLTEGNIYRVIEVDPDPTADRTKVTVQPWQTAATAGTPEVEGIARMPDNLTADALDKLVVSLRDIGQLKHGELTSVLDEFASALLTTFTALADMSSSRTRDTAIEETVAALEAVKKVATQIKNGSHNLSRLKKQVDKIITTWVEQALAILETGTIAVSEGSEETSLGNIVDELLKPQPADTVPPRNAFRLSRDVKTSFASNSDLGPRLLTSLQPALQDQLYAVWRHAAVTPPSDVKVYAFRTLAAPFGHNAPKDPHYVELPGGTDIAAAASGNRTPGTLKPWEEWDEWTPNTVDERSDQIFLDAEYEGILPGSFIAIQHPDPEVDDLAALVIEPFRVGQVVTRSRSAYGLSAKTTRVRLAGDKHWWNPHGGNDDPEQIFTDFIRGTTVYAESEELILAEEPIETPVGGDRIELADLYDGLESGRWLIVAGERADIPGVTGVMDSELVMLAGVEQVADPTLPGDKTRSTLLLANRLQYTYKRGTVGIFGNVVKATHGETRSEVLGSGDGSQARQQFTLGQSPLTYVAASTPDGAESTLVVRVNDVQWHEAEHLLGLGLRDRTFITRTDEEEETTVVFGDGERGARLPTGRENVRAVYRTGIGSVGNVDSEQISSLVTRPLGVREVINPLRASGGADRDSQEDVRRNAPLAVTALDRLVSAQDYADFARTFAGIGKASAAELSDGRRQLVHVTIAGVDDVPIDESSDLYQNLRQALHQFGDPHQPIQVDVRELKLLVISAKVRLLPDYQWESVEPQIRAALLGALSFERRELDQDVTLSEVITVIQVVEGVAYVDVDILDSVAEDITPDELEELGDKLQLKNRVIVEKARIDPSASDPDDRIKAAQLAYLTPDVADTLILTELTS